LTVAADGAITDWAWQVYYHDDHLAVGSNLTVTSAGPTGYGFATPATDVVTNDYPFNVGPWHGPGTWTTLATPEPSAFILGMIAAGCGAVGAYVRRLKAVQRGC